MRCPFNVRGSACYLIMWRRATEIPPGPTRLDSAIPSILLTSKQQHWGGTLGWGIHLRAAFRFWCISVCVCVCLYIPQGLHLGWMLCRCYKWSFGRLADSRALHSSTCLITTHTYRHTHARVTLLQRAHGEWSMLVPGQNSQCISCQLRESVNQLVQVSLRDVSTLAKCTFYSPSLSFATSDSR